MTLHILSQQNTVLNKFIAEIRDKRIQRDSMRFRRNMERIGEITAYEISKAFSYKPCVVETPLGEATVEMIDEQIVVATILRASTSRAEASKARHCCWSTRCWPPDRRSC